MIGKLLLKGMQAGIIAGVMAFIFAHHFGEPQVDKAIAFEESIDKHENADLISGSHAHTHNTEESVVSRATQSGFGLFSGIVLLGASLGGGLALIWAFSYQRVGQVSPKALALYLAFAGFLIFSLIPSIKYPPNPPAVGNPDTIGYRTGLYFTMLLLSACYIIFSVFLHMKMRQSVSNWNSSVCAFLVCLVFIIPTYTFLPAVNEIPDDFSADLLWRFRLSSIGIQLVMWITIGISFGFMASALLGKKINHLYK